MEEKISLIKDKIFKNELPNELNDLFKVGANKPVGYLPMGFVDYYKDYISKEELKKYFESKGLSVKIFPPYEEGALGEDFFVWDRNALESFLKRNENILKKNEWTSDTDEFINKIGTKTWDYNTYPELHLLIAYAFADYDNPSVLMQQDLKVVK